MISLCLFLLQFAIPRSGYNQTRGCSYTMERSFTDSAGIILQRNGKTAEGGYGLTDDLAIVLTGNHLERVDDASGLSVPDGRFEFRDGAKLTKEYLYDGNGNLTADLNRGIAEITYNVLNLPEKITFADGTSTEYTYSHDGRKLRTVRNAPGLSSVTDYCGNVIYRDGKADLLLVEGGYVTLADGVYHFYLTDHQGNVRVVANEDGNMKEVNHYYPFGGLLAESGSIQPYKYNGKELDEALQWYDYGARYYDAAVGRFTTVDPMTENSYNISPYVYCHDNPLKYVDPTGKFASPIFDLNGHLLGTDDEGLTGDAIFMAKDDFKQGMSHAKALEIDLGYKSLMDEQARASFQSTFEGLKDRPDYDGYLTLSEANEWYRNGNGKALFASLDKIDLSGIYSLGESFVGEVKGFNLLLYSNSLNDGLVYGNITLKRYPNHSVRAYSDYYNFEMHSFKNPLNWGRNLETLIGRKAAGFGTPYEINIYGSKRLKPLLPWLK